MTSVGVADAIASLREELQRAMETGANDQLRFRLSPIELTLQVIVTKQGNGKVGWHILDVGGSAEREATQTLAVHVRRPRLDAAFHVSRGRGCSVRICPLIGDSD
jgi:hypothetical protein